MGIGLGLLGVIDGIHMRIIAPSQNKHNFVNGKCYHSNSVLFFFCAEYKILDIAARWPASRMLSESGLRKLLESHVPSGEKSI